MGEPERVNKANAIRLLAHRALGRRHPPAFRPSQKPAIHGQYPVEKGLGRLCGSADTTGMCKQIRTQLRRDPRKEEEETKTSCQLQVRIDTVICSRSSRTALP